MHYTLYYGNFEFAVEQNYQDILEFEFSKAFGTEYTPYTALQTQEQKDFIKDFNYKWMHNEIHEYDYYTSRNFDFLDWLKAHYEDAAEDAQWVDEYEDEDMDPDDWWDGLDYTTKEDVMETYNGW